MITAVPYSAINRFEPGFLQEWEKRVAEISRGTQFVGGPWVKKLETRLAEVSGAREARGCANGTDAIQLALRALGVGTGDRVLVPDLTFWATFEAVCNVGARPVTVDVDLTDLHPSVAYYEEAIDRFKPKAVVLVHLYGWAARDTLAIRSLCATQGIALVEDSAQAWGVKINGRSIFADAPVATTSFFPGKVLGCAGDGGAVFSSDPKVTQEANLLANHGRQGKYEHHRVGWNSRLDNLQAAYVDLSLDHIAERIRSRREAAEWYRKTLRLSGLEWRAPAPGVEENGYISVAMVDPSQRERIGAALTEAKVGFGVVYPGPLSAQPGAESWIAGKVDYGNSRKVCTSVLNLPCFAGITEAELQYVGAVLEKIFK